MEVACALWESWQDDALVRDRNIPLFADPSRVRRVDHDGKWFKVRGPLNVSRSPQGRPVFVQAGASHRGRDFAARWAEVVFVTHSAPDPAREFRLDCGRGQSASAATRTDSEYCPVWYRSSAKRREEAEAPARLAGIAQPSGGRAFDLVLPSRRRSVPLAAGSGASRNPACARASKATTARSPNSPGEPACRSPPSASSTAPAAQRGDLPVLPMTWRTGCRNGGRPAPATGSCCRFPISLVAWNAWCGCSCRNCNGVDCSAPNTPGRRCVDHLGLARPPA